MSADNFRILGDKQSRPVALLVSNDFNAAVRLDMLINDTLKRLNLTLRTVEMI